MRGGGLCVAAVSLLFGCAGASSLGDAPVPMIGGSDDGASTSTTSPEDESSEASTTFSPPDATTTTTTDLTGGTTTAGATTRVGTSDGSSSSGGSGEGVECDNEATCPSAANLGIVSGDEPSAQLTTSGSEPTWITFQVTEDNDNPVGEEVSFTVTLTSPPGYDFDLFVFRGPEGGSSGCGGVADDSTAVGELDVVSMTWGEGMIANGVDDSAWVAVQIQVKGGLCDPTLEWDLTVEGDT